MLRKFKENLFKWWIGVNTSALTSLTKGWYYRHRAAIFYYSSRITGVHVSIDMCFVEISEKAPETKEDFVNAVYKHLTDGTAN